ncbi:MAG: biopolymer transporter ExbD [Bacteroidales bacterium]|nr:biopolymer transporter ExbD [Bacteroidales bacterium]MCF8403769.1 biopolymer transporter ExbD [Bacteroidales bacterium]
MARPVNEINAGSMADIAFLLLIFFLVTTTMDTDTGITRKLPPPPPEEMEDIKVKERNIFKVLVNKNDRLLLNGKPGDISMLKIGAKEFLQSGNLNSPVSTLDMPEKREVDIPLLGGTIYISKGIISLKNDRGTSYDMYIQVQNELAAAIRELRDDLSNQFFQMNFEQLSDDEKIKAIQKAVPVAISEAEPEDIGGK